MQTLYRYKSKERLNKQGFLNSVMLNDAYVIGANRNYYLNIISIVLFALTIVSILFHVALRIFSKK